MVSDLLKKMAVLTKVSNSLGQNAQIDWQGLVDELITRKYLSFRGKDTESTILTLLSGFGFAVSSTYDLGSDYLVSKQFINGTEYIKEVENESELELYHELYVSNSSEPNCHLIGTANYSEILQNGTMSNKFFQKYHCFEQDPIWGALVATFIFLPGVLFSSLIAYQIRKKNLLLPILVILMTPFFPFFLILVKFLAIFNEGPQMTRLKNIVSLCEGQVESMFQLGLQVFIILYRADRKPSYGVYYLYHIHFYQSYSDSLILNTGISWFNAVYDSISFFPLYFWKSSSSLIQWFARFLFTTVFLLPAHISE